MPSRYNNRLTSVNNNRLYKNTFEERNVNFIRQYRTANLAYPTTEQMRQLTIEQHVWKEGDRYYKFAYEYYGNSKYWWVLAWFNKRPTEAHVKLGDVISIPTPLDRLLNFYDV
jgi:nucleoid-associated protein YgaU